MYESCQDEFRNYQTACITRKKKEFAFIAELAFIGRGNERENLSAWKLDANATCAPIDTFSREKNHRGQRCPVELGKIGP